jgi:small subunit ribosomal protein S24e
VACRDPPAQVPQFLLDELIDRADGRGGSIVVTQPRRLAAIAVAQRVAEERGEVLGDSVGYQVLRETRARATLGLSLS